MKANKSATILFLLATQCFLAQENVEKIIKGKIVTESGLFSGIEVVNLGTEKSVKVDENGEFQIAVKETDVLFFASKNFEPYQKTIQTADFCDPFLKIPMITKGIELDEVIINKYANINARSLGIIPQNQRSYTVAERRLKAGSGGLGGLINVLSGRKEMLKKELEIEKKDTNLEKLKRLFDSDYYQKSLHITFDKIKAFQYYCIENSSFAKLITTNNRAQLLFAMLQLAHNFNEISTNEGKI